MATLLEANEVTKIYAKGQRPSLNKVSFNVAKKPLGALIYLWMVMWERKF